MQRRELQTLVVVLAGALLAMGSWLLLDAVVPAEELTTRVAGPAQEKPAAVAMGDVESKRVISPELSRDDVKDVSVANSGGAAVIDPPTNINWREVWASMTVAELRAIVSAKEAEQERILVALREQLLANGQALQRIKCP